MSGMRSESQWKLPNQDFSSPTSVLVPYPLQSYRISQERNVASLLLPFPEGSFPACWEGTQAWNSLWGVLALVLMAMSMARLVHVGPYHWSSIAAVPTSTDSTNCRSKIFGQKKVCRNMYRLYSLSLFPKQCSRIVVYK